MEVMIQIYASPTLPAMSIEYEVQWAPEEVWELWNRETSVVPAGN
jgi:hypothetical protein